TQGVVTLEDVVEQLVGDIEDEFDTPAPLEFVPEGESYRVAGTFPLHELQEKLPIGEIDAEEVDTVGGFVTKQLNRWPRTGDVVPLGPNYTIRVAQVQSRRVARVIITPVTQQAAKADGPGTT